VSHLGFDVSIKTLIFIIFFKLLLTLMLMAVIVYLYTVIAFNFFRKFYANEEDEHNCKDLFTVGTLILR
jgi:ABC-type bacteriocin/lantibiotic exporter with double-glycine peptidase domain